MKQAIDLDTGRLVDAEEATEWGQGAYKCPCCFDSVTMISPESYAAYFRHLHASFRTDCENYQVGSAGVGTERGSGDGRWLALYVILSIKPRTRSWHLELFVPDPGPALQLAHYSDANGERTLQTFRTSRGGRRIPVLPQDKDYRVEFGQKNSSSSRKLEIPGLQRQFANAFHFGDSAGRRLGTGEPLVLGDSYVVICHSSAKLAPLDQVKMFAMGQNQQWMCTLVSLPTVKSNQLQSWCYRQFRRDVIPPEPNLSLTFPPSAEMFDDGTWAVSTDRGEIYLACSGPSGSEAPAHIGWKARYANRPDWVKLGGDLPAFFLLPAQYKSWYEVLLRDHTRGALEILVGEQTSLAHPTGVELVTRDETSGTTRSISLLNPNAKSRLQAIREGQEGLVSITLPGALPLIISVKACNERFWKPLADHSEMRGSVGAVALENSGIESLRSALLQAEISVRIDAGNFGFVELPALPPPTLRAERVVISDRLRNRFLWLLTTLDSCERSNAKISQPLGIRFAVDGCWERIQQDDRAIIQRFDNVRSWPEDLLTHARVAACDFMSLIGKGT